MVLWAYWGSNNGLDMGRISAVQVDARLPGYVSMGGWMSLWVLVLHSFSFSYQEGGMHGGSGWSGVRLE